MFPFINQCNEYNSEKTKTVTNSLSFHFSIWFSRSGSLLVGVLFLHLNCSTASATSSPTWQQSIHHKEWLHLTQARSLHLLQQKLMDKKTVQYKCWFKFWIFISRTILRYLQKILIVAFKLLSGITLLATKWTAQVYQHI